MEEEGIETFLEDLLSFGCFGFHLLVDRLVLSTFCITLFFSPFT
jgi:hypothetical protein